MNDMLSKKTNEVTLLVVGEIGSSQESIADLFTGSPKKVLQQIMSKYNYPFSKRWGVKRLLQEFTKYNGTHCEYLTLVQLDERSRIRRLA